MTTMTEPQIETARSYIKADYANTHKTEFALDDHIGSLETTWRLRFEEALAGGAQPDAAFDQARAAAAKQIADLTPAVKLATFQVSAKQKFIENGGTESQFTEQWPSIRAAWLQKQAIEGEAAKPMTSEEKLKRSRRIEI